ncbi:hypothetical protein C0J52_27299 [Blattella germanica]|nr:hypothetical protein C0J52_27299 [Blattella germanica]
MQKDAILGKGVYLTSLPPSTSTSQLLLNNWDLLESSTNEEEVKERLNCLDFCIEFNSAHLLGVEKSNGNRDIWVYPGCIDLTQIPYCIRARNTMIHKEISVET